MSLKSFKLIIFICLFFVNLNNLVYADDIDYASDDSTEPNKLINEELINEVLTSPTVLTHNNIKNEEKDEYDDEMYDSFNTCTAKEFISGLNCTQYLPDDYEQIKNEKMEVFVPSINGTFAVLERLHKWMGKLMNNKDLVDSAKFIGPRFYESLYEANLPPDCMAAFLKIASNIQNRKLWAIKFFDSMGNIIPSGLAGGRMVSLGEYDECVSIESDPEINRTTLYGQYCQLKVALPYTSRDSYQVENEYFLSEEYFPGIGLMAMQLNVHEMFKNRPVYKLVEALEVMKGAVYKLGICIPHVCQPNDIENAINKIIYPITKLPVSIPELTCASKVKTRAMDDFQKVSIITFSIVFCLVILSTAYEIFKIYFPKSQQFYDPNDETKTEYQSTYEKVALSFSVITNTKKLIEVPQFPAIYSLRLFLTYGYFTIMVYLFPLATMTQKYFIDSVPMHVMTSGRYFFLRNPILWVDALICCFGLLMTYNVMEKLKKTRGNFNYGSFVWQRWARVTIPVAGSILITYLVPMFGDGPVWNQQLLVFQTACRKTVGLLGTIFSYNNYMFDIYNYKLEIACPVCNPVTWYFSTTYQIYIFTPILFLSLYKWPKFGIPLNIGFIIFGTLSTLYPKFLFDYINYNDVKRYESIQQLVIHVTAYYLNPLQYIAPFAIGMFTGYALHKHPNINLGGKRVELLLWVIAISVIPSIYVWNNTFWSFTEYPSEVSVLLWYSLGRSLWAAAFGWFYFACSTGRGGIIAKFLSIRAFQPITKLNYTIYILQVPVLTNRIYRTRDAYIMTDSQLFQDMYVDLTVITICAYIFYMIFERPLINLLDLVSSKNNWSEYDNSEMYGNDKFYKKNLCDQLGSNDKKCAENGTNNAIINVTNVTNDSSESSSINVNGSNDKVNIIQ